MNLSQKFEKQILLFAQLQKVRIIKKDNKKSIRKEADQRSITMIKKQLDKQTLVDYQQSQSILNSIDKEQVNFKIINKRKNIIRNVQMTRSIIKKEQSPILSNKKKQKNDENLFKQEQVQMLQKPYNRKGQRLSSDREEKEVERVEEVAIEIEDKIYQRDDSQVQSHLKVEKQDENFIEGQYEDKEEEESSNIQRIYDENQLQGNKDDFGQSIQLTEREREDISNRLKNIKVQKYLENETIKNQKQIISETNIFSRRSNILSTEKKKEQIQCFEHEQKQNYFEQMNREYENNLKKKEKDLQKPTMSYNEQIKMKNKKNQKLDLIKEEKIATKNQSKFQNFQNLHQSIYPYKLSIVQETITALQNASRQAQQYCNEFLVKRAIYDLMSHVTDLIAVIRNSRSQRKKQIMKIRKAQWLQLRYKQRVKYYVQQNEELRRYIDKIKKQINLTEESYLTNEYKSVQKQRKIGFNKYDRPNIESLKIDIEKIEKIDLKTLNFEQSKELNEFQKFILRKQLEKTNLAKQQLQRLHQINPYDQIFTSKLLNKNTIYTNKNILPNNRIQDENQILMENLNQNQNQFNPQVLYNKSTIIKLLSEINQNIQAINNLDSKQQFHQFSETVFRKYSNSQEILSIIETISFNLSQLNQVKLQFINLSKKVNQQNSIKIEKFRSVFQKQREQELKPSSDVYQNIRLMVEESSYRNIFLQKMISADGDQQFEEQYHYLEWRYMFLCCFLCQIFDGCTFANGKWANWLSDYLIQITDFFDQNNFYLKDYLFTAEQGLLNRISKWNDRFEDNVLKIIVDN